MKTTIIKKIITISAAALLFTAGSAFATVADNVNTLKTTNACVGCDFTAYNFATSGISMAGKNISKAILNNAIFTGMKSLSGMNITGATMNGMTRFTSATLTGVIGLPTVPPAVASLKAQFLGATWVDGTTICKAPSIGTCNK